MSTRDPFFAALAADNTLGIDPEASRLWLKDLDSPLRWVVLPVLKAVFSGLLMFTWWFKRLMPFEFRAHGLLQWLICWFCEHFVTAEANVLILRHFATESNLLNFLVDNAPEVSVEPVTLYPRTLWEMMEASFVDHDQELFRAFAELGPWSPDDTPVDPATLCWDHWREIDIAPEVGEPRWTRILDFETAHVLFMCLFCFLLTKREYRAAINGFQLDQSVALRIGQLIGDPTVAEMAYNKHPLYLVDTWNLTQRFLMHGFFTEYLYGRLEQLRHRAA